MASNKNSNFPSPFCLGSICNKFDYSDAKVLLKENTYDFSVDCNSVNKSDTLNIYKYLMIKNNI